MVGERAVQLEIERNYLARQIFEDVRNGFSGYAVPGIDGDLERFYFRDVRDERDAMARKVVENVFGGYRTLSCCGRRHLAGSDAIAHRRQTMLERKRLRLLAREFHSVVVGWIVRCRNHHAAVKAVFADGE